MKPSTLSRLGGIVILVCLMSVPAALAQTTTTDTSTLVITEATDVGGKILQPGTYRIAILDQQSDRSIARFTSPDGRTLHATVLTVPRPLMENEEPPNTRFLYYTATSGQPRALRTWYPANAPRGIAYDFVYDEDRALELARASETRVVYYQDVDEVDLGTTRLQIITPEARVETYTVPTVTLTQRTPMMTETRTLPATAGRTPLFALLGLLLVGAAIAIRAVNR